MEWVPPWCTYPTFIEPMGAVPKKGADEFRAIADARHGNKGLDKWGVRYFSVREFVDLIDWNYIVAGTDWRDAYHLWRLAGCTGDIVVGPGVVGIEYICNAGDSGSDTSEEEGGIEEPYSAPEPGRSSTKAQVRRYHMRQT